MCTHADKNYAKLIMRVVCHINNLETRKECRKKRLKQGQDGKRERILLGTRRRYEDNVDCEESRIGPSPLFGFLSHAFLIVARHPYDSSPFAKMPTPLYLHAANLIKSSISHIDLDFASVC